LIARFVEAHERGDAEAIRELITRSRNVAPAALGWRRPVHRRRSGQCRPRRRRGGATGWTSPRSKRKVTGIVVDGDTAVALEPKTAMTYGGEYYANDYCWAYTCRDGLIWKARNFADTLYADRLFGLDNKTPTAS
jgi:ketosteroid isomerase-like protein